MSIQVGDRIPSVPSKRLGDQGMEDFDLAAHVAGKTVILFAVPGAFTPSCDQKHLPGYVQNAEVLKQNGVDEVLCIAVNDPFVMKVWGESAGAEGKVTMVPDGNAEFTKAIGLTLDASGHGLGLRSLRYVMVLEDGVVKDLQVENSPGDVDLSGADACAARLKAA